MDVILLESIDALGKKGEIVKVKNGYARNYLLPQKKAMRVTADTLFRLESLKVKFAIEENALVKEMRGVQGRMDGQVVEMNLKATEEGHLFGSVTPGMIVSALAELGYEGIKERRVRISEPIRSVGSYVVSVRLHSDVMAEITVAVDSEDGMLKQAAEKTEAAAAASAAAAAETAAAETEAAETEAASAETSADEGAGD